MGRGGKIVYKRAAGRPKKNYRDEDEDDESYVAEEEESSSDSDASSEENFDASEANSRASSEEDMPNAKPKFRRSYYSGQRRYMVSDYEELEDDDFEDDKDFSPDATDNEDWEGDSLLLGDIHGSSKKKTTKQGGRKLNRKVSKPKVNGRSSKLAAPGRRKRRRVEASDDDGCFIVKGRSAVKRRRQCSKKASNRTVKYRSARKKRLSIDSDFLTSDNDLSVKAWAAVDRSKNKKRTKAVRRKKKLTMDSETSDSDFMVSDKDLLGNDNVVLARPRKINKTERSARTSRKQLSLESGCTDSDDEISEKEVKDLEIHRALNMRKHEGSSGRKGKEKEVDDLAKQLCGICLSEEHNGTIQGILNCCSHYFCFSCIMEWSKVESRCPLCKRRFVSITKSSRSDPMLELRRPVIRVQMRDQVYQPSEEELRVLLDPYEDVVCMECHQGGDDSLMLLCDICDSSAHSYCVGLGSEVPEGNWYCECCKLADEGPLHSQVLDSRGASSSHMSHDRVEENCSRNFQSSSIFQRSVSSPGQSSSQGFDLNAPPRNFKEDNGVISASQASGAGASTLSGRRALHQRIRVFFSNNRARQIYAGSNREDTTLLTEAVRSVPDPNGEQLLTSDRTNSLFTVSVMDQRQENSGSFLHSNSNLNPSISNGGNFRHVEGAKEQIQSMVKSCLNRLRREVPLERSTYIKIARKSTHTILAACGIQHCSRTVSSFLQPPGKCCHDLDSGPVNLLRGCCSSCFGDYVKDVVQLIVETL